MKLVPVVAVALIGADGRVLMQRRRLSRAHGGLWEFPGGKVEGGESPEQAAVREMAEELAVVIAPAALIPVGFASDPAQPSAPRQPHLILLYLCRQWDGDPQCLDAEAIAWVAPGALQDLTMPPLDYPLAAALVRYCGADLQAAAAPRC